MLAAYHRWVFENHKVECVKVRIIQEAESIRYSSGINNSHHHATLLQQKYLMPSETVLKSTYMDNSMDSVPNDNQGIQLYQQLSKLWDEAGMQTHKWLSNSEVVLSKIPPGDQMCEVNLDSDPLPSAKTLEIMWRASEDVFTFVSHVTKQECDWTN